MTLVEFGIVRRECAHDVGVTRHETYFMGGGIQAIYDDMNRPIGLARLPRCGQRAAQCSRRGAEQDAASRRRSSR